MKVKFPNYMFPKWKGAGDVVASVAKPAAMLVDKVFGTDLQNCGSCEERQDKLNNIIPFEKPCAESSEEIQKK